MPHHQRLLSMSAHAWTVASNVAWHHLLPCCWQLWNQNDQHGWHETSCLLPPRRLLHHSWFDRVPLLHGQTNVGLHQLNGQSLHARLHQEGTPQLPTPSSVEATACTIQGYPNPVWGTSADSYNGHHSPTLQRKHQMCAGSCRYTPLLRTHGWPNHSSCHQRYCVLTGSRHQSRGIRMSSTSSLCCYTSQCRHPLPHKQYDPRGPHQCIVPFQTQRLQSGISALLPHQQRQQRIQKWHHSKPCQHHQTCNFLGIWYRTGGSLLRLCKIAVTLDKKGHMQPPTPVTTDNIMAQGLTVSIMTPKASKSMDQWFHWLKCHSAQCQFLSVWRRGILNRANYTSKHHAPKHHQAVCPFLIFDLLATQ